MTVVLSSEGTSVWYEGHYFGLELTNIAERNESAYSIEAVPNSVLDADSRFLLVR